MTGLLALLIAVQAGEIKETYDAAGRLTHRVEVDDAAAVVSETTLAYDAAGRLVSQTTTGATTRVERWTFDDAGRELTHVWLVDGVVTQQTAQTWVDGRRATLTSTEGDAVTTTTFTYDDAGRVTEAVTTAPDGTVTRRVATFTPAPPAPPAPPPAPPVTPIKLSLSGGLSYQTDVDLFGASLGFAIDRKPAEEGPGKDPLELHADVSYAYGRSRGDVVNNALHGRFSIDLNQVAPRVTPFLFIDVDRNPAFNQNIDLELAPIGVKFMLVPRDIMKLDFSFAPVINYRSVAIPAGTTTVCNGADVTGEAACDFLKVRGSFRLRVGYGAKTWDISDTVEYLPNFTPKEVSFVEGLSKDSILRNTFAFNFKLTSWLTLSEAFIFTRDQTLAAQADCGADPDLLLCDGLVFTTATNLVMSWSLTPGQQAAKKAAKKAAGG
jgi:YD repeat-containing protein